MTKINRGVVIFYVFTEAVGFRIYNKLLEHPNTNNILAKEQFGFRKISTTEQAIRVNKLNFSSYQQQSNGVWYLL